MGAAGRFEQDYFEKNYRDYDRQNPARKLRFYCALAERAAASVERPRVLDLGCAFGKFLGALGPRWERFGLDASEFAIERARRSVPGATFAVSAIPDVPFAERMDVVTAFDVLEHVSDLEGAASAVRTSLTETGSLLFVVPTYDGPTGPLIRALDRDETHLYREPRQFWLDWTRAHFQLVDWCGIYRYLLPGGSYLHRPTKRLRRFTPAIAVVARR
jgi:SAM-dependent methyltransferase